MKCANLCMTFLPAGMAELADAADSKSAEVHPSWGFNSPSRHQFFEFCYTSRHENSCAEGSVSRLVQINRLSVAHTHHKIASICYTFGSEGIRDGAPLGGVGSWRIEQTPDDRAPGRRSCHI